MPAKAKVPQKGTKKKAPSAAKRGTRKATAATGRGRRSPAPSQGTARSTRTSKAQRSSPSRPKAAAKVRLLSGGNPQIAKGDGNAPVRAYIAAMPGWKREVGKKLDALIARAVPKAQKAVKWNSPFYGIQGRGWFTSFHVFTHYVKVTFFRGTSLRPVPPVPSKDPEARYVDIHEGELDERQMARWMKQAAALPGWVP